MKHKPTPDTSGRTKLERQLGWQRLLLKTELALLMVDKTLIPVLFSGPALYSLRQELGKQRFRERRQLLHALWRLERQGMILRKGTSLPATKLTEKGRRRLYQLAFDLQAAPHQQVWDGRWHVIIFDVPEKHRIGRDLLRKKLYQLGCVQLQQSVFIYPYDIREQIERLRSAYDLKTDLNYLIVESLDQHEALVELFQARGILQQMGKQ